MDKPTHISFTDLDIPLATLFRGSQQGPMNLSWVRTQFAIPNTHEASRKVELWLLENCPGRWASCLYQNPKSRDEEHIMIVRFQDKNDALMFKLRDGHKAWEIA